MVEQHDKDKKKLGAEELEKRAAPFTIYTEPAPEEPVVGTGGTVEPEPVPDQPGQSDAHRDKLFKENQE